MPGHRSAVAVQRAIAFLLPGRRFSPTGPEQGMRNEQKENIQSMLCWPALRQRGSLASGTWGVETTPGKTLTN
jgi:hypothetical protein